MNLLSTDSLAPAGDVVATSRNAPSAADREQSGGSEFSGMLKSSLDKAEAEAPADESQVVDLNKVNGSSEVVAENSVTASDSLQAEQLTSVLIELESDVAGIGTLAENSPDASELVSDASLLQIESEQLANDKSGIGLPPVAAAATVPLAADAAVPVATQMAGKSAAPVASPVQVVMSQTVGVAVQADLASGQQGNQSALQQSANPLPLTTSDGGPEQLVAEFKLNTVNTVSNQGSGAATLNTPAVISAGTPANPVSTTTTPLMDSTSVSLQSMSLGRGESSVDVGNGLADRVQWMVNHKQNVAHIRLDPPLLGKLDVQVKVMDDSATITIQTQQGMTRDMIDAASHRLREALQENGFQNVNVDVSHREDPGQPADEQPTGPLAQAATDEIDGDDLADALPTETWMNGYQVSGMVDTFA